MTSFINVNYSTQHPGVARVESAIDAARQLRQGFPGMPGLAALLLSAMAAATMVVAYQVMDSITEGHLLVMWTALWAVAFAALALFSGIARNVAARLKAGLDGWSRRLAAARADQRLWAMAQIDHRVMADLQMAMLREEARAEVAKGSTVAPVAQAAKAAKAERTEPLVSLEFPVYPHYYI